MTANVLGVVAGILGSLYAPDILSAAFHLGNPFKPQTVDWAATWFWGCLLIFGFSFLSREWAVQELQQESEKRLSQSYQTLTETMATMPPRGFVLELGEYYTQCYRVVRALQRTTPNGAQIEQVIQLILRSIASLARKFDAEHGACYGANVMLHFASPAAWSAFSGEEVGALHVAFIEPDTDIRNLPVLVLQPRLSAQTEVQAQADAQVQTDVHGGQLGPDPALNGLRHFALPVLEHNHGRSADGKRYRVLPGAPLTFVVQEPNAYADSSQLGAWCRKNGDFSDSICQEVEAYFRQEPAATHFRSFASIPITSPLDGQRLGVLNMHSNRVRLLWKSETPSQFYPAILPLQSLLAELLAQLLSNPKTA